MEAPGLRAPLLTDKEASELYNFGNAKDLNYDGKTSNTRTIHFKGSIVTHPDTTRSHAAKIARFKNEDKCKFGIRCVTCRAFRDNEISIQKKNNIYPSEIKFKDCTLYKDKIYKNFCPGRLKAIETGKKEKSYEITPRVYRDIADRVAWMKATAKNKVLFCVLTLPKTKRDVTENELNGAFSKFVENLRRNYGLLHYLAVREDNGPNNRLHYHCIFDIRFIPFNRLNSAWCSAVSSFCYPSKNAFRTSEKSRFIRDAAGAVRYICKYVSKLRGIKNKTRIIFCDHETARAYVAARFNKPISELKKDFKTIQMRKLNNYVSEFVFTSRSEQNKFFEFYVRSVFNVFGKNKSMRHFSGQSPGAD